MRGGNRLSDSVNIARASIRVPSGGKRVFLMKYLELKWGRGPALVLSKDERSNQLQPSRVPGSSIEVRAEEIAGLSV